MRAVALGIVLAVLLSSLLSLLGACTDCNKVQAQATAFARALSRSFERPDSLFVSCSCDRDAEGESVCTILVEKLTLSGNGEKGKTAGASV